MAMDKNMSGLQNIVFNLQICREPSWIVALDANADVNEGPAPDFFQTLGGVQLATARHEKPIPPLMLFLLLLI